MEFSQILQHSWSFQNLIDFDQSNDLSIFINSNEYSQISEIASNPFANLFTKDDHDHDLTLVTSQLGEEASMDLEEESEADLMIESFLCDSLEEKEGKERKFTSQQEASSHQFSSEGDDLWSPNSIVTSEASSMDYSATSIQSPLNLPREEERIKNEVSIRHLLQALAEAKENGQKDLEEVILGCINEKVTPFGDTLERVAFNLCHEIVGEHQQGGDDYRYLKQESLKNSKAAIKVFIESYPYVWFSHYVANSAILEAIPKEAEAVHIVDFDMGEGIQLSQIIEALGERFKTLKVTTIKWEDQDEDTKMKLQSHARSFGLNLKMEQVEMDDLASELKKAKKRDGGKEFVVFNCMNSLPHMMTRRSRVHVIEYLKLAKDFLVSLGNSKATKSGIIAFADGDASHNLESLSSFSSFFNQNLVYYQALLESMEMNFPSHLAEARMVMECIFVSPLVSSQAWFEKWTETKECDVQPLCTVDGRRLSEENLLEAREIVGDEGSYGVRVEGKNMNEMVLEWRGTPLVRVSTWES